MPLVTVVIPTYNRADLLSDTVNSVLVQSHRELEVIVVDDGSQDHTKQVIAAYGDKLVYQYKENGGQASARNLGIRLAHGEYIAFVDSDDLWLPNKLHRQIDLLTDGKYAWGYCDTELFDDTTGHLLGFYSQTHKPYQHHIAQQLLLDNFIASPTPVIKREIFEQVGYFDEAKELRSREDWEMWLRIAAMYPVAYVREPLARYRIHANNVTRREDIKLLHQSQMKVIETALSVAPDVYNPVRRLALAAQYIRTGRTLLGRGDIVAARAMFLHAIRYYPLAPRSYLLCAVTFFGRQVVDSVRRLKRWHGHTLPNSAPDRVVSSQ